MRFDNREIDIDRERAVEVVRQHADCDVTDDLHQPGIAQSGRPRRVEVAVVHTTVGAQDGLGERQRCAGLQIVGAVLARQLDVRGIDLGDVLGEIAVRRQAIGAPVALSDGDRDALGCGWREMLPVSSAPESPRYPSSTAEPAIAFIMFGVVPSLT